MSEKKQLEPIEKARLLACQKWPYAANVILSLVKVPSPLVPHIACDRHWRIYYNPAVIAGMDQDVLAGQILREISRLCFRHHDRAQLLIGSEPTEHQWKLWNLASDYAVNDALRDQGIALPADAKYPEEAGLPQYGSADDYYIALREKFPEPPEQPQGGQGDQQQGDGQQSQQQGKGQGQPNDKPGSVKGQGQPQQGEGGSEPQQGEGGSSPGESQGQSQGGGSGQCEPRRVPPQEITSGSSADGIYRPWEKGAPGEGDDDALDGVDAKDADGLDPAEAERQIRKLAERIDTIGHGHERGGFRTLSTAILHPAVDPKTLFRRYVTKFCQNYIRGTGEYSYRRQSRRSTPDMPLPMGVEPVPRILVIVDTSGSMDQQDIGSALGFVDDVLRAYRLRDGIEVACADTQVHSVTKIAAAKQLKIRGGGGTDMSVALQQIVSMPKKDRPELVVVATDGYTGWPKEALPVPAVAVVTRPADSSYPIPDWMPRVHMTNRK